MPKIAATIEFANFAGDEGAALRHADAALLAPMFERALTPPPNQLSAANVVFLYAKLADEDAKPDPDRANVRQLSLIDGGVRRIAERSGAKILVVAMANSTRAHQRTLALGGPKGAHLILTLDRQGEDFANFFKDLFELMAEGQDMLGAWVEIAPQGPVQPENLPATVVIAEGGRVTFPKLN